MLYPTPEDGTTLVPSTVALLEEARAVSRRLAALGANPVDVDTVQATQIVLTEGACAEGDSLGPADDVIEEERKAFWEQQMRMNVSGASISTQELAGSPQASKKWTRELGHAPKPSRLNIFNIPKSSEEPSFTVRLTSTGGQLMRDLPLPERLVKRTEKTKRRESLRTISLLRNDKQKLARSKLVLQLSMMVVKACKRSLRKGEAPRLAVTS